MRKAEAKPALAVRRAKRSVSSGSTTFKPKDRKARKSVWLLKRSIRTFSTKFRIPSSVRIAPLMASNIGKLYETPARRYIVMLMQNHS